MAGCDSGQLSDRWASRRPSREWSRFRGDGARRGSHHGRGYRSAEWFALRRWFSGLWVAATTLGLAAGLTAGAALVDYGIGRGDIVLMGAVTGVGVGVLQALVLARHRVSGAFWWAVANPPAVGWLVTSYVISRNVKEQFTIFGASGAIVFGLLTWFVLAVLLQETEPEAGQ
jgi:hypothetical protein